MTATNDPEVDPPVTDNLYLEKVDDGRAPKARLSSPKRAQDLCNLLVEQGRERSRKYALLKGQLDGNRPFNPARMRANAQSWRTNVNFREAKAAASAALTPFYDLFTASKNFFFVETRFGQNAKEIDDYSKAITEEANYHVQEEDDMFDFNMQAMLFEMITYGKSFLFRIDKGDWRSIWLPQHTVRVPDNTKAHTSKLTVLTVEGEYLVSDLWQKIQNEKSAENAGWNIPYVKHAIQNSYTTNATDAATQPDYEAVQQRIKDNDLCEGYEAEVVPVFHIFVAEYSGKVSHLIVPQTPLPSRDGTAKPVEFLYESVGTYDNFAELITPFFFETWDASWNGATGLSDELFDQIELKNRLKCNIVDGAFLRASIVAQASDINSLDKLNLLQIGAFTVVPPGLTLQQSNIMGDLQSPLMADQMLEQTIAGNIGVFRPKMDKPQGNPRTAKEVEITYSQGITLSNSAVNRFYLNLDRYYKELVRRLVKDRDFQKRCEERGIPPEALKKIRCVKAYRTVGNGSSYMRQQAQSRVGPLVPMMPEAGRIEWARDTVTSEMNTYAANRYFPDTQDDVMKTDHAYDATLENTILKIGGPVIVTPKQNDVIHAQTHLQFAAGAAATLDKGGNPVEVLNAIDSIGPHTMQHIQRMKGDPYRQKEVKILGAQLQQLSRVADNLRRKIKQQQEAAAEAQQKEQEAQAIQQGVDPDTRIKMAQAQQDMQISQAKAAQQMQHKAEAHQMKMAAGDAKTAAGIAQSNAKTRASIAQSTAKTAASIQHQEEAATVAE